MSVWRTLIFRVVVVLLVPLLGRVVLSSSAASTAEIDAVLFQTYPVTLATVRNTISAVGRLEADRTSLLSFVTGGRVTEVFVRVGDRIEPGMVLANLDNTQRNLTLQQTQRAYEEAQMAVQELRNTPTQQELTNAEASVTAARSYTAATQTVLPNDIASAEQR